jgi:hypothetical protein
LVLDLEPDDVEELVEQGSDSSCDSTPFAHAARIGLLPVISTDSPSLTP